MMAPLSSSEASNKLLSHLHPEIQQVKPCFGRKILTRCSGKNLKCIYKANFHNKVEEKLPVFFGWSANRILCAVLHASVDSTHITLIGRYWWRTHNLNKISTPSSTDNWTISKRTAISAQNMYLK